MDDRIGNLEALKAKLAVLLDRAEIQFSDDGGHATACWVDGTPKAVLAQLKRRTAPELWSEAGEVVWTYKNNVENILITLQWGIVQGFTLVMASVISLHMENMARCQQALVEAALLKTSA